MTSLYHPCIQHPEVEPQTAVSVGPSAAVDALGRKLTVSTTSVFVWCLYCGQRFVQGVNTECRRRLVGAPTPPEVVVPASRRRR